MPSSVIRGAWYFPDERALKVLFVSGRTYLYSGVPAAIANGLASARSKGSYYNRAIRDDFPCREITDEES